MPTKRAKKEVADAAAGESAAGKRSRSTNAAIKAPDAEHNTVEDAQLSSPYSPPRSNSNSNSVVSIPPPPEPIDVDAETCEAPAEIKSRRATHQTTLAGEVLSTEPEPSRVATKQSRARGVADGQKGGSVGGELKPVAGAARMSRKRAAPSMRLEGPAAAPLLEEALLVHTRSALARNFMLITERTIELAAQPHAHCIVGDLDTLPGTAAVGETAEPADVVVSSAKSLMLDARGAGNIAMRAVLPCVQYFIVSECARVARVVREEGGNGYGDDPATRAAELLGFLLSMLDKYDTFSDLFALACPSCRVAGVSYSSFSFLTQYLALSQRASADEIHLMDQKSLIERLGLLDGCRATTGQPLDVMECCPFGEAHLSLYLLVRTSSGERHNWRLSRLWWQHVPFQLLSFPAIAKAAKAFDASMGQYTADRTRDLIRYQHMAANSGGKWAPPTSKQAKSPKLTAAQRALIKPKAGCLTWAEELFGAILPETATHPWHRNSEDLQSRIRSCYAYTCADVNHGGYFSVTLEPTLSLLFSTLSTGSFTSTASFVQARLLFAHMKVCQHVAEALLRGGCCSCHSRHDAAAAEVLFVEAHGPFMTALRHCRDESYLLTDNDTVTLGRTAGAAVDVDAAEETTTAPGAVAAGGCQEAATFYAAGSFSRFQATLELTGSMNAAQIVNYVTQVTAESTETLPAAQIPRQHIRAELKRHQLENVQRMWNKECEGYREHVSVPLYHVDTAAMPAARQVGVMYYCAATNETIVVRGSGAPVVAGREAEAEAWKAWNAAGGRIRGGLLCDDVGLGKTLSILTLCAYDRAVREAGNSDGEEAEALVSEIALAARKVWQVSAKTETMRSCMLWSTREVLHWAFGNFRAGIVPHPTAPTRLPHTTLVVVPLSIATQWIEEIHKFYPTASYILFYGAKRAQYTAADMRRADFVITTYETLSTHLRQEACGLQFWLARVADEADDAVCAKAASHGWSNLMPSELFAAVQRYASDVVWPAAGGMREAGGIGRRLEMTHICDCTVVPLPQGGQRRTCGSHRSGGRDHAPLGSGEKLQVSSPASDTTTSSNTWTLELDAVDGVSVFRCPTLSVSVTFDNSVADAAARSVDRHTRLPGTGAVSDAFLDHTWELLRVYSATTTSLPVWQDAVTQCRLFDDQGSPSDTSVFLALLYHAAEEYTLPDSTRRELVRRVLLPPLWRVLAGYWVDMKAHYADVAVAETTGRSALRVTDLLFRRVVLDESQKCGATSLFHLLSGERRWAVTGTPLNNNKTESLAFALRFLGMHSAARLLSRPPFRHASLAHAYVNTHNVLSASDASGHSLADSVNRGLRSLWVRRHSDTLPVSVASGVAFCLCAQCVQRDLYSASETSLTNIPSEYRLWTPPRDLQVVLPCLPNSLFEVLTLTMVRHERDEQVSRELQLTPARYQAHSAALTADEMRLYDRVALVIMNVAARLHRQGILSSRMGYVMQWVQDLCRLCLHPSRVGNDKLLRGDIEAHMLRGVRLMSDNGVCGAGITEVLAASFVAATPQEALEWVKLMAAARKPGLLRDSSVPEETATTLAELAQVPPLLPQCGVCMDNMAAPTLLKCFHMFCKECVLGVIDASREVAGNVSAKCPYCRDRKSMLEEKRVVTVDTAVPVEAAAETRHDDDCCRTATAHSGDEEVDVVLASIGDGSRVRAFLEVVEEIWRTQPDDGVLVFSKYPAFLKLAHDAVAAQGYAPHMVCGASSLAQRQRAMRAMQPHSGASVLSQRRILFVTSRSANAGLNLTFANHVVFLEPNLNPAIEQQAVGRVHRFGQLKQVIVHHFFAPHTIEEAIYRRSVRLREQAAQEPQSPVSATIPGSDTRDFDALQRRTQFGRIAPAEALLLLEYPVPPQTA